MNYNLSYSQLQCTVYNYDLQLQSTITIYDCNQQLQSTITIYNHNRQLQSTITIYNHNLQLQSTIIIHPKIYPPQKIASPFICRHQRRSRLLMWAVSTRWNWKCTSISTDWICGKAFWWELFGYVCFGPYHSHQSYYYYRAESFESKVKGEVMRRFAMIN